jgi:hypothetical protein
MTTKHHTKSKVHLIAFDKLGKTVLEQDLPARRYCEESHPVLDDPVYRKMHTIVRLSGFISDATGKRVEEFEAHFDTSGACVRDAARLADGTVLGKWDEMHVPPGL